MRAAPSRLGSRRPARALPLLSACAAAAGGATDPARQRWASESHTLGASVLGSSVLGPSVLPHAAARLGELRGRVEEARGKREKARELRAAIEK
eukprot:gene54289-28562_t